MRRYSISMDSLREDQRREERQFEAALRAGAFSISMEELRDEQE
jgi:hypothetical protein